MDDEEKSDVQNISGGQGIYPLEQLLKIIFDQW